MTMKVLSTLTILLIFLSTAFTQESQATDERDSITTLFVYLDRVYIGTYGYKITYGNYSPIYNVAYLPYTWFAEDWSSFARTFYSKGETAPYLIVYFNNDEVSNIHLYIPENLSTLSVKTLFNYDTGIKQKFDIQPQDFVLFPEK